MDSASSSSQRRPRPTAIPTAYRPMSTVSKRNSGRSSLFLSRLPADPFSSAAYIQRDPIVLNSERLYNAAFNSHPTRDVILVLGDPNPEDVSPLFNSERLAFSLLIFASHQPPPIPSKVQPTIRILRLAEPLALEQAGAVRFVNVLEWAERVARTWRKVGGIGVRELAECDQEDFGALALRQNFNHQCSKTGAPSAVSSTLNAASVVSSARTMFSIDKIRLRARRGGLAEDDLPSPDPSQRPFDALVNYLPSGLSDKSLLKHVILVTTITRPFLVAAAPPSTARSTCSRKKSSLTLKPVYMISTPPGSVESLSTDTPFLQGSPLKAHLVHVLPARPRNLVGSRLVDSIETFLLSFSFPPSMGKGDADAIEPAHQCLLESTAFAEPVGTPPSLTINWTMADVLLSNCLDDQPTPRVWFSGASDIVVAALPQPKPSRVKRPKCVEPSTMSTSSRTTSPALNQPGINVLPTPPDSEEGTWYRLVLPVKETWNQRPWRLKFWKRPTEMPIIAR